VVTESQTEYTVQVLYIKHLHTISTQDSKKSISNKAMWLRLLADF